MTHDEHEHDDDLFIASCTIPRMVGGLRLPVVYATGRASAAVADAYRYVRGTRADAPAPGPTDAP
jgi:hypothetical protein